MKYAKLGNTDIEVSKICIGGMSFGEASKNFHEWTLNQEESTKMIKEAYDLGVNFIDTANCYSFGTSEQYIGKALKELQIPRDKIVIASKVYFNEGKLSKQAIKREIEKTLTNLQTTYLDLYQIHRFDYDTPILEVMEALNDLVKEGKVRAIGASAMYGYQFHNMQVIAEKYGLTLFSTMQNHYNLLYREDEREMIPICKQYNVSLIPYSPLAGGHLTHTGWSSSSLRSQKDNTLRKKYDRDKDNDLLIIERVNELAKKYHVSMAQISLAWLFKKGITSAIVGATKLNHFVDATKAVDLNISDEDVAFLEELYINKPIVGALPEGK